MNQSKNQQETASAPTSTSVWSRMARAARLDISLYQEVEADTTANGQALTVVVLASLATGIGTGIASLLGNHPIRFLWGLLIGLGTSIGGWLLWSLFAYWIGNAVFRGPKTDATYGQLLRTLGFANSAGIVRLFSFIPFVGGVVTFVASVWVLVAGVIAVREALDFSTWRAIGTCIVGWVAYMLLLLLLSALVLGIGILF